MLRIQCNDTCRLGYYLAFSDRNCFDISELVTTESVLFVVISKSFLTYVTGLHRSKGNCVNSQVSMASFVVWHLWRFRVNYGRIHHGDDALATAAWGHPLL